MEHQSTGRGLSGERQFYILENKKDANKFVRRRKATRNNSLSNTERQGTFIKAAKSFLLPSLSAEKKSKKHHLLRHNEMLIL